MTPSEVVAHFGSNIKTAAALDKTETCIRGWLKNGAIPYWSQLAIQTVTNNKLKAVKETAP